VTHSHGVVHSGVGEGALASGAEEVLLGIQPLVDRFEVLFEVQAVDGVAVGVGEMMPFDDVIGLADIFGNEVGDDLLADFGGVIPFGVVEVAGHFDDKDAVFCGGDLEAGIFRFTDPVENPVAVVGVEAFKALGFFDEESVGDDGFVVEILGG